MKARYREKIVNIILTEETDCFLIETEIDPSATFWFTMKDIPVYKTWKKMNRVIGDLKENKMYRWIDNEDAQLITKNLILETE